MKHESKDSAHLFALFIDQLQSYYDPAYPTISFKHEDIWRRIVQILRLRVGQKIQLFNQHLCLTGTLHADMYERKKQVIVDVVDVIKTAPLRPTINLAIGLLKKDAMQEVAQSAGQLGVATLSPLLLEKIQRKWGEEKEHSRLIAASIAGCEQAKSFIPPTIKKVHTLQDFILADAAPLKVYFEAGGEPFVDLYEKIKTNQPESISMVIGTEGGLSFAERGSLRDAGYIKVALTPNVLRSVDAVVVGVGALRALF